MNRLQNSCTSTAANYRAARRGRSRAEFIAKLAIVSEEADESVFWLERMRTANIVSSNVPLVQILAEAEELARTQIYKSSMRQMVFPSMSTATDSMCAVLGNRSKAVSPSSA